jgi:hypothetical protein
MLCPQTLKEIEDRLRPKGDDCGRAGGTVSRRLREKQGSKTICAVPCFRSGVEAMVSVETSLVL